MRQSILRDTKGPILWYDESSVDFGSYNEAKNRFSNDSEGIKLTFNVKIDSDSGFSFLSENLQVEKNLIATLEIEISEKVKTNYISELKISFEDQKIELISNHKGQIKELLVNDTNMIQSEGLFKFVKIKSFGLLPLFFINNKNDDGFNRYFFFNKAKDQIDKIIGNRLKHKNRIDKLIESASIGSKSNLLNSLKENSISIWNKKTTDWDINNDEFNKLNNLIIAHNITGLLSKIDNKLRTYLEDTQYIAPVRAKALRYYRYQDLSVSEIDSYGDNMHMFIDNLTQSQKLKYQEFIKNVFGFTANTESKSGHVTINIEDEKGESYNLADLGFGYSQVLPIITKLWYVSSQTYSKWGKTGDNITVLIEQPELHLHPAMQAQLADAFVLAINLSKENGIKLNLIIETHSSTIINRLGRKIIDKKIEKENVNVILFNPDENLENSIVTKTSFNDKGILLNWPLGFFEPKN